MKRIPPSTQMREALTADLQAGFASHPLKQFVRRAAEFLLQVGLEEQLEGFLGRGHYERNTAAPSGYRNGYGDRTVKSESGALHLRPPKARETATPFSLQLPDGLRRVTPELGALVQRAYVRDLSVRDVEGLYAEVFGASFSKSAASRATATLQADFDAWRTRDLSAVPVVYLFLDAQFHAARSETTEKEGILAAYALCEDGRIVLLHLGLGPRESTDAWVAFLHDLTARGVNEPLLVILDGNPGLLRAVKQVFPGVRRRRLRERSERRASLRRRRWHVLPLAAAAGALVAAEYGVWASNGLAPNVTHVGWLLAALALMNGGLITVAAGGSSFGSRIVQAALGEPCSRRF